MKRACAGLLAVLLLPLAGCSGTATTLNAGTWARWVEALGYCPRADGSGLIAVRVNRLNAYNLPGLTPPLDAEGTAAVAYTAEGLASAMASAAPEMRWREQLGDGREVERQRMQVTATDGDGAWTLTTAPAARCDQSTEGWTTDGIPWTVDGRRLHVVPDILLPESRRRHREWWHWPALALVPLGFALDVATFPAQAGGFLMFLSRINRAPLPDLEFWLLIGLLVVLVAVWNAFLWWLWRRLRRIRTRRVPG